MLGVIIPFFNRIDALRETLRALAQQTLPAEQFKVLVVDDGSHETLLDVVTGWSVPHNLCCLEQEHKGPAAARNRGAMEIDADLYVFLDADMIPVPDLLQQYVAAHAANPRSIICGRQLPWSPAYQDWLHQVFPMVYDLGPKPIFVEAYQLASGNMAVPRPVLQVLGGFDEKLMMTEDTDLGYRAGTLGIDVIYWPKAIGYHNHPKTFDQLCAEHQAAAWWQAHLVNKHPTLRGQVPNYQEVEPIDVRRDSISLLLRKLVRRLLAFSFVRAPMTRAARSLEQRGIRPQLFRFLYFKVLTSFRLFGYREGWRDVVRRQANKAVRPRR